MLYRIVYYSRNEIDGSSEDMETAINAILAVSRRSNQIMGITGALLFNGMSFAQVLEGERESVESVFARIMCDPRHSRIVILEHAYQLERHFAKWAMAYSDAHAIQMLPDGGGELESIYAKPEGFGGHIVELLRGVVDAHEDHGDALSNAGRNTEAAGFRPEIS